MYILVLDDNIEMHLREIGWDYMNWINLAHDRDQRRALVKHGNEASSSIKCWDVFE
jgi:hypothetical protein